MAYLDEIDALGGTLAAIEAGFQQRQIQESAYRVQRAIESRRPGRGGRERASGTRSAARRRRCASTRRASAARSRPSGACGPERDPAAWARRAAAGGRRRARAAENLMPALIEAVKAYATVGEVSNVLRARLGRAPGAGERCATVPSGGDEMTPAAVPAHVRGVGRVHHVAVVVRAMDAALAFYRDTLGLAPGPVVPIPCGPGEDRVPARRRGEDRARRADGRDDRRGPLPREPRRGLPPRLLRGPRHLGGSHAPRPSTASS